MDEQATHNTALMKRWEFWAVIVLSALLLLLAMHGKNRRHQKTMAEFVKNAQNIQLALDKLAADSGGYPPDTADFQRPQGLTSRYIRWKPEWRIDYEVGDNFNGGQYVCLEFCGPEGAVTYEGLCSKYKYRRAYPAGQAIPGQRNRIWLIKESAAIVPPLPEE